MIGQETRDVERKIAAILRILSDSGQPLGGRVISRRLKEQGVELNERTVRYHLKIMDERGLTRPIGHRDGRTITQPGLEELRSSLVCDKIGFVTSRIEILAYLTTFDLDTYAGNVPVDVSLFSEDDFPRAWNIMKYVFESDSCTSQLVAVAAPGEKLGDITVPQGKKGLATVSSVAVSGALLKAGIPIDSRFGGLLQIRNGEPARFVDLIEYHGCTLDPFEIFIAGRMTNVTEAVTKGEGKILASFHESPIPSRAAAESVLQKLKSINLCHLAVIGKVNEATCEVPVMPNKVALVLPSGLNAVAATVENGINVTCKGMGGVMDVRKLRNFHSL